MKVQFRSNQYLSKERIALIGQLAESDPEQFKSLSMPRKQVVEPDKTQLPQSQAWHSINHYPKDKVEQVIRPKIVIKDRQACQHIVKCIENEQAAEQLRKQWQMALREQARQRLFSQHDKNI